MQDFWRDRKGKVVIAQSPNAPLIVWFFSFLMAKLPIGDSYLQFFELLAFGAIFTWAWMELFEGVNLFRRLIGLSTIAVVMFLKIE